MGRHISSCADRERVVPPAILRLSEGAGRVEAATRKNGFAMQALLFVAKSIDFDDAAHLAPIFSRNAGGVNRERVHILCFNFGAEAGRTIVGEWNAVDHELRLVLGASGMKHGVAFIEPARLRIDEIGHGAPRNRGGARGDFLLIQVIGRAGLLGIEQRDLCTHVHGGAQGGNAQLRQIVLG